MRKIILASHGMLAEGMLDSLSMIYGDCIREWINVDCLKPGEDVDLLYDKYRAEIMAHTEDSYVFVTDIKGGSVNTTLVQLVIFSNVEVITGMNLGMLLQLLAESGEGGLREEQVQTILSEAREGIEYHNSLSGIEIECTDF